MGEVVIVTGPPGAGKSTVAQSLADLTDPSALVDGDEFFAFMRNGAIAPWLPAAHKQNEAVIEAAAAAVGRLASYCDVVYDGVVGPWFLPSFLGGTRLDSLHYAVLLPPLPVCLQRVQGREGHKFTDLHAAERIWKQFERADIPRRHLVDPRPQPDAIGASIAVQVAGGTLRYS